MFIAPVLTFLFLISTLCSERSAGVVTGSLLTLLSINLLLSTNNVPFIAVLTCSSPGGYDKLIYSDVMLTLTLLHVGAKPKYIATFVVCYVFRGQFERYACCEMDSTAQELSFKLPYPTLISFSFCSTER